MNYQKLFRLWLGVTEYLFRKPALLDEVIDIAIEDNTFRSDDLEFTFAARVSLIGHSFNAPHVRKAYLTLADMISGLV